MATARSTIFVASIATPTYHGLMPFQREVLPMPRSTLVTLGVLGTLLSFFPQALDAQEPAGRTVTGHGMGEIKRQAELLRVQVEVVAKGKTLKEALTKLRERRQAAQKNLEQLGASAASIEFGEPQIVIERNDRQQQRMMMMMAMRNGGKKPPQKPKEAPPLSVSCSLKAELRLAAAGPEDFLLAAHALEERIKAADLGGLKEFKQASAQDEEMAEEQNAEMMGMNEEGPKRGEPIFLYVSKVSDEERDKARSEAFKKARDEARRLAAAAGIDLGPLYRLDGDVAASYADSEDNDVMTGPSGYMMRQYLYQYRGTYGPGNDKAIQEAIGLRPGKVTYRIGLSAAFELRRPK
jgi:hypothetical protein